MSPPGRPAARSDAEEAAHAADRAVVTRMANGDQEALAELYDRHARPVYSLALRIVGRPEDADDVTQQVFTQAWRSAARYDTSRGAVAAWLLMISRSRALDCLRRRGPLQFSADDEARLAAIPDPEPSVELVAATREEVDAVRVAMEALPEEQRTALDLAYYGGLTQTEIAERTSTPLGTVKTRVRSALQTLRRAMGDGATAGGLS